jgi:addiction module RelE/StbE family toxin
MIKIGYKPKFLRQYKKLSADLKRDVKNALFLFQKNPHDVHLRLHKLSGHLNKFWSLSINYEYRVIIGYENENTIECYAVGTHDVYR